MKEVTINDCLELRAKFDKYCETAEQHEFTRLLIIQMAMDKAIAHIQKIGKIDDQKNINAMFRVVLRAIGEDYSEYEKV